MNDSAVGTSACLGEIYRQLPQFKSSGGNPSQLRLPPEVQLPAAGTTTVSPVTLEENPTPVDCCSFVGHPPSRIELQPWTRSLLLCGEAPSMLGVDEGLN